MTKKKSDMKNLKLLIVESPAKIKTISKFLGKDFKIMSTFGHIKDLPQKKLGVQIDDKKKEILVEYVVMEGKGKTIADICKQASRCSDIYLASDPDREGEIISWHIEQEIEKIFKDKSRIHRISFNEITKPAILESIKKKSSVDMNKVSAQQARRVLDRWVGYEVSPILWRKIRKGLSAGRVQSVALLLICKREEKVVNFKPEEYWSVHGNCKHKTDKFPVELFKINKKSFKLKNKIETERIIDQIKKETHFQISKITKTKRIKKPMPPFMTSTLQQDSYNKLGFSVSKTMSIAQKLYEGIPLQDSSKPEALITYMRTDSMRISNTAIDLTRKFISTKFGSKYLPKGANLYSKSGSQDAHEAIRPINMEVTPQIAQKYLKSDEAKLYSLIWKRFVACQMAPAQYFQRQVLISGGKFIFKATGTSLMFDGFLKIYSTEENEEKSIKIPKNINDKDIVKLQNIIGKQHFTQPPPRYTEASLVKELEKQGVGRPSTYASILFTIQKREYVTKGKKKFQPTELGKAVDKMLRENLPDIINVKFTAHMEEDLDKIANGEIKRDRVLFEFYDKFKQDLQKFGGKKIEKEILDIKCPKCDNNLVVRFGKAGNFAGCTNFPECDFTSNFTRNEQGEVQLGIKEKTELSDIKCPQCGKNLIQKIGKFGPFLACPGYPKCKYIHQEKLNMPCPECGNKIVKRKWRGGTFWGCSGYPKCKFSIFGEVKEQACPKCESPYLLATKNKDDSITLKCPNKKCDYKK